MKGRIYQVNQKMLKSEATLFQGKAPFVFNWRFPCQTRYNSDLGAQLCFHVADPSFLF